MRVAWVVAVLALAPASGCKDRDRQAPADPPAAGPAPAAGGNASGSTATAARYAPLGDPGGRCETRTPGVPFPALHFYPDREELFVPTQERSAFHVPLAALAAAERKLEFSYRWKDKDGEDRFRTAAAVVRRLPDGALSFLFETLKQTECVQVADATFHRPLPDLGIAGTFRDAEHADEITFVSGEQTLVSVERGKRSEARYRVARHEPGGATLLYVSADPPDDSRPQVWLEWRLRPSADGLAIDYMGRFERTYRRVDAASAGAAD